MIGLVCNASIFLLEALESILSKVTENAPNAFFHLQGKTERLWCKRVYQVSPLYNLKRYPGGYGQVV
jgi:hypothetical protein